MIVTPGHTFAEGEEVTRQKLNLLGSPVVAIEDGDVGTAQLAAEAVTPAKLAAATRALLNGFKNKVINGNFDFERRDNTASPATGNFPFDRWAVEFDGTAGTVLSVAPIASNLVGSAAMEDRCVQVCRWNQSNAGSGDTFRRLRQRLENARTLANQTVSISFWTAMSNDDVFTVSLVRNYGTGGSPSSTETIAVTGGAITGIAGWEKRELTVTLPNVQGKSFGTNDDSYLELRFALPINATFDFYLALVQVELGSVSSDFEQRGAQFERFLCDRYYTTSFAGGVYPDAAASTGPFGVFHGSANTAVALAPISFPVPMRAQPAITVYSINGSAGAGSTRDDSNGADITGINAHNANPRGFSGISKTAAFTTGRLYLSNWTANAEL